MDGLGLGVEHAAQRTLARMDVDTLGEERARVEAAQRLQAQEALVLDVAHQEANLIHVRGQHHARTTLPALGGDDIAQGVRTHLVDEGAQLRGHDARHGLLA